MGMKFSLQYVLFACVLVGLSVALAISPAQDAGLPLLDANQSSETPTIVLDAGHGGEDSGAVGKTGVYEKDINLAVCLLLADLFREKGYTVVLTRTEDKLLYTPEQNIYGQRKAYDLRNRHLIAEECENAILVSIHVNSYPSAKYSGLQVWYGQSSPLSKDIAKCIQEEVKNTLQPQNNRNTKQASSDIYLLYRSTHPAVLVECGFLSNVEECEKLSDQAYQKELSFAIFCGILKGMGVSN